MFGLIFDIFFCRSSADFFEYERSNMSFGDNFFLSNRYLTFPHIVNVFPAPAPAIIKLDFSSFNIAVLCSLSKDLPFTLSNIESFISALIQSLLFFSMMSCILVFRSKV